MSLSKRRDLAHKAKLLPLAIWSPRVTVQLIENDFTTGIRSAMDGCKGKRNAPALAILRAYEDSRKWKEERVWRQREVQQRKREEWEGWWRERDRRMNRWLPGEVSYPGVE
jgi:hypothetical protein